MVVAVILITGGGSSSSKSTGSSGTGTGSNATGTSTGPTVSARLPLRSPSRASRSIGLVEILSEGAKRAFYIAAEHLPATHGFFYALWLYNSPGSHEPLSKAPPVGVQPPPGRRRRCCPPTRASFREILLTRETSTAPHPSRASGPARALQPDRLSSPQLPGVHDPGGVELGLQRAQRRAGRRAPTSAPIHGAWSRPTA